MDRAEKEYFAWCGQRAREFVRVAAKGDGVFGKG